MKTLNQVGRVGNDTIDNEHLFQMRLIKALDEAIQNGKSHEDIDLIFDQLIEYTRIHFLSEELLMRLHSYSDYSEHCLEHGKLMVSLEKLHTAYATGKVKDALNLIRGLETWLHKHVDSYDTRLGNFLQESGGAASAQSKDSSAISSF